MDPDRRAHITVRRFSSFDEADRHDLEYWMQIPEAERVLQVWRLSRELWQLRGGFEDESAFSRSVESIRRS